MKVVLFCGGLGTRIRDYSEEIPKPLIPLGSLPIMWHVMKYYAHYGHRDFVLCLGYKAETIKKYFLDRATTEPDGSVVTDEEHRITLPSEDGEWRISFVDTGISSNVGQRLKAVEPLLRHENIFLANYADGLTDFPLPRMIADFKARKAVAMFLSVRPTFSFHLVRRADDGRVLSVDNVLQANAWINGGYFVFSNEIFDYIKPGEELVEEPFQRLIAEGRLFALEYDGFWRCVDTFKDLRALENLLASGNTPWTVWETGER